METNNLNSGVASPAAPEKIGKVRGGYLVVTESFKLLGRNKSIMMFPFAALVVELLAVAAALAAYFFAFGFSEESFKRLENPDSSGIMYLCLFIFYVVSIFIASYFQAGLVAVVSGQINGKKLTYNDGMKVAAANFWKIFFWSSIAATVGVILQFITSKSKYLGRIVANLLGAAWDIITFFIVPVLVLENDSVGQSIKRSALIFKNKWGQTLIANFSTGLFFAFLMMLGFVAVFLVIIFGGDNPALILFSLIALAIYLLMLVILSTTIEGIYRVVLYEYAAH
ncbi:MAG: DUF6159 family protein [Candidatus Paceibacterota bacterium]